MLGKLWAAIADLWSDPPPAVARRKESDSGLAADVPVSRSAVIPIHEQLGIVASVSDAAPENPVLVRREILDERLEICGYEFMLRTELSDKVRVHGPQVQQFLDGMLFDHLPVLDAVVLHGRRTFIRLTEGALLRHPIGRLPARAAILLAPRQPQRAATVDTLERIAFLRQAGRQIWLDDCPGTRWFASLSELVDGAVIRLAQRPLREVPALLEQIRAEFPKLPLAVWDVATMEEFDLARRLGCVRFSGGFVTHRTDCHSGRLSPQTFNIATLINQVHADTDIPKMATVFKQDMAMSYRLLRYANAVGNAYNGKISSIEQALIWMGQSQLDRWLTLLLLNGGAAGSTALLESSLTRARFLELLGAGRLAAPQCESLFVLGLFSMLDVALKVPLEEAIRPLRLPDIMISALLRREGPMGAYLSLAEACDDGDAGKVLKYSVAIGLTTRRVNERHIEALGWVNETEGAPLFLPADQVTPQPSNAPRMEAQSR
ncbi:MAG TPA: HDOD domain-containing protein [Rhodocyclaceae bacterium]|nr:HDOD domain-containing protein [Rhodocyclaceae bacterium]